MKKYKILGEKIKGLMEEKKIKTVELSEKTGVSQGVISNIRRGDKLGRRNTIDKIINGLCETDEEKKDVLKAWSLERGHVDVQEEYFKIEQEAENMKKVLDSVQPEIEKAKYKPLANETIFLEEIIKILNFLGPDAKKILLEAALEKYIIELDRKDKYEEAKPTIKRIKELINKL